MSKNDGNIDSQAMKVIRRLRLDPRYQAIEQLALNDPENVAAYAERVIREFRLDIGWKFKLQHYLLNPKFTPAMTGASIQPFTDPVTEEVRYMIPVSPDTTLKNVESSYRLIMQRYTAAGLKTNLRSDDELKTDIQLYAFRRHEDGLKNADILKEINEKFGEDKKLFDIPYLIKEGGQKKLG